jgi:hypothetical protein
MSCRASFGASSSLEKVQGRHKVGVFLLEYQLYQGLFDLKEFDKDG